MLTVKGCMKTETASTLLWKCPCAFCLPNCSFLIADSPQPHLDKKPSLKDACNLLIGHSAQWDDIHVGLQFEAPFDDRDGWLNSNLTNRECLQRILTNG